MISHPRSHGAFVHHAEDARLRFITSARDYICASSVSMNIRRHAGKERMMSEIDRLRCLLAQIEKLANEGRDDAIDNRGHVIDLEEADQFEAIAVLAREAMVEP